VKQWLVRVFSVTMVLRSLEVMVGKQ
jgi:hypothetical protein